MSMRRMIMTKGFDQYIPPITDIGWWHFRMLPNTTFQSFSVPSYEFNDIFPMRANANTMIMSRYGTSAGYNSMVQMVSVDSGNVDWTLQWQGNSTQYFFVTEGNFSVSNSDIVNWRGRTGGTYTGYVYMKIGNDGSVVWSSNVSNVMYNMVSTDSYVYVTGAGGTGSGNSWISKISQSDGLTVSNTFSPSTVFRTTSTNKNLFTNQNESLLFWFGQSNTGSQYCFQIWTANSVVYSGNSGSVLLGYLTCEGTDRTDSANSLYLRSQRLVRDFMKFNGNARPPTVSWRRAVPSGNIIDAITHDETGNCYVAMDDGIANLVLTKVNSAGTAQWSRKFRSTRAGDHRARIWGMYATPEQIVLKIDVCPMFYDATWQEWTEGASVELHYLRLPSDGSNTGTYSNLIYETTTTVTLTAQTTPTYTTTFAATNYPFAPTIASRTDSMVSNVSKYWQATAI